MIGEILIIGLQLALLASMSNEEKEPIKEKTVAEHKNAKKQTVIAERKEPKISNSGERFVQCPLEGYRSYYLIGDWGTIKRTNGKIVKTHKKYNEKPSVFLRNDTTQTSFTVERLVALSFLVRPAKDDAMRHRILHKNNDVADNRAINLMWK